MATVNEQLNIPILRAGETMYQPELYGGAIDRVTENKSLVLGTAYYRNANGSLPKESWSGCNSCGGFSSADASSSDRVKFEICVGKCQVLYRSTEKRNKCISECKSKHGINDVATYITAGQSPEVSQQIKDRLPETLGGNKILRSPSQGNQESNDPANLAMSKNTKVMIAVGALIVVGALFFMIRKNK